MRNSLFNSSMLAPRLLYFVSSISVAGLLICTGCSNGPEADVAQGNSFGQLNAIQQSYFEFFSSKNTPPKSKDDLAPILKKNGHDVGSIFVSERDNEEFVMIWDVDPTNVDQQRVLGYEATSVDGSRLVFTNFGVMSMSDEEFSSATFPSGHSPANISNQ